MDSTFTVALNVYNNANLTENLQIKAIKASSWFLLKTEIWFCYSLIFNLFKPSSPSKNYSGTIYKGQNLQEMFNRSRCIYFTYLFICLHNDSV